MTLAYLPRLMCLCFSFFFLLNAASGLLVRAFSGRALRLALRQRSSAAAHWLLALRLFPFALTTCFVLFFCVPSYLRFEPAATSERVGFACILCGILGAAVWSVSLTRAARALIHSVRYHQSLAKRTSRICLLHPRGAALFIDTDRPVLALSGLLRPRILISRGILEALSPEELHAALSHEQAHRVSRDNFKRLLLTLAPDVFPFVGLFRALDRSWAKLAEWAADDQTAAGNSGSALSLAAALVHVARLGKAPALPYLSTSLVPEDDELRTRVDRLLGRPALPPTPRSRWRLSLRLVGALGAVCVAAALFAPAALSFIHELQELLLR
jgi:Zn-dependent protease with chaperone function